MIYNTMKLADATLSMVEFLMEEDDELVLNPFNSGGENGYTLRRLDDKSTPVSFAQYTGGDSLVIYKGNQYSINNLSFDKRDNLMMLFGCDDIFNAAKYILEKLNTD